MNPTVYPHTALVPLQRDAEEPARIEQAVRVPHAQAVANGASRSLLGETLVLHLAVATVIGALAFGGLWWASSLLIRDQMHAWGEQWLDNLEVLAVPSYASGEAEWPEAYIEQFAEISFVRYYSRSGETIRTQLTTRGSAALAPLDVGRLEGLASGGARRPHHLVDTMFDDRPIVRIAEPIWARSVAADGLLGFDPDSTAVEETLAGYVELGLDFSNYRAFEARAILTAVAIGVGVLFLLTTASWLISRRALRPLAALRGPLQRLAAGDTRFDVTTSEHREFVAIAGALRAAASALDERNRRLAELAKRDALTGLPNQAAFNEILARDMEWAEASDRTSALVLVDLDQFKYVNGYFSYAVGDSLLQLAAGRLQTSMRVDDVVARFSGDEFVLLLRDVDEQEAEAICAELIERVQGEAFFENGQSFNVRCSIGATMIRGREVEPAQLLSRAAAACHQAKATGRNRFCFYKVSSREIAEMTADAEWSQKIQTALKEDRFVLHYQPIVNIRTGETAYYEVLLRMLVEDDQLVLPGAFLPAAARVGLMADIDHWVMRRSLRSLAAWRAVQPNTRFTLNVSGTTFDRPDFFGNLEAELRVSGVPLDAVVIEITEQIAMRDTEAAAARMTDLVARGCRFAIDDFGAGYCSYSYLKSLPVALVKIDGSFIANLATDGIDQKIVGAIAEIAAAANCETIAEHVKDDATLALLDRLGVAYAQGYVLGKPSAQIRPGVLPGAGRSRQGAVGGATRQTSAARLVRDKRRSHEPV